MDKATVVGLFAGAVLVAGAIVLESEVSQFISIHAICIVFGGSFGALLVAFPLGQVVDALKIARQAVFVRVPDAREELDRLLDLSRLARRNGLMGLESRLAGIKDPFLRRGLEMVIDRIPPAKLHDVLEVELGGIQERHLIGKRIFDQLGSLFPAMGMVGTLIGLVQMLSKLEDPSKIGAGMAVAMIATFYGAAGANMLFLPLANKLEIRSKEEVRVRELMIRGLTYIAEGDNPRLIEAKLSSYLSPSARKVEEPAAVAST